MEISNEEYRRLLLSQPVPPAPRPTSGAGRVVATTVFGLFALACVVIAVYLLYLRGAVSLPMPTLIATPTAGTLRTFRQPSAPPPAAPAAPAQDAPQQPPALPTSAPAPLPQADVVITKYINSDDPEDEPFIVVQDRANPDAAPILITDGTKRRGAGK